MASSQKPTKPDQASQLFAGYILLLVYMMVGLPFIWGWYPIVVLAWAPGVLGGMIAMISFSAELYKKRFSSRR